MKFDVSNKNIHERQHRRNQPALFGVHEQAENADDDEAKGFGRFPAVEFVNQDECGFLLEGEDNRGGFAGVQ